VIERLSLADGALAKIADGAFNAVDCAGRIVIADFGGLACPGCYRLVVREGDGERELARLPVGDWFLGPIACDRQGRMVAYAIAPRAAQSNHAPSDVWVVPLDGGVARALTTDHQRNAWPTFVPDGRSVVFSSARDGTVNLWEAPIDGGPLRQLTFGAGPDASPAVSPDGKLLLFDVDVTSLPLFSLGAGGAPKRITFTQDDLVRPIATPDGREVIAAMTRAGRTLVVSYPVGGGEEHVLGEGGTPALSPDGATVYWVTVTEGRSRVVAAPRAGGPSRSIGELPGRVVEMVAARDGLHARLQTASASEAWRIRPGGPAERAAPAPNVLVLPDPTGPRRAEISRSPSGRYVVRIVDGGPTLECDQMTWVGDGSFVCSRGGEVHRIDRAGHDRLWLHVDDLVLNGISVSPSGDRLYYVGTVGRVRRQVITNFADRPPLAR
jgi:dipeptidyl aminopeptidase/acylaminoacyl peptidase